MRKFEKVSEKQFIKDTGLTPEVYNGITLPTKKTVDSAGYDFISYQDIIIKQKEIVKIPTGIKVDMNKGEVLFIVVRSSMGFKYNLRLCNQVGIIDRDYYNNEGNEGHIFVALQNEGEKEIIIKKDEAYVQGIILKYYTTNDEVKETRKGGIGSTNKEEK